MRASRSDGEATRARILEAALPLFAAHGYAGTSVRAVAGAAGVNIATLAYHFEDKEGLYDTVVQRLHHDLVQAFPTVEGEPELRVWVGVAWRFCREHREHLRLLVRHVLDHGSQPGVILDRWSEPLLVRAEGLVALFRPDWPSTRRRLLVLSLMHLTVRLVLEQPEQLAAMTGIPLPTLETEIVDWLTAVAARELGLPVAERGE
ncbi:MAG: TetR family transcriptional regulator [Myxococcota bacterium]